MTLPSVGYGARLGSQTPRICVIPPYAKTYGDEVNDFMAQIGRPMDPWQELGINVAFAVTELDLWAAFELVLLLSRQNGKGGVTEGVELGGLFLFKEPLILHSAHQFKTSTAAFRRLIDIIDGSDWLTRRVKMVSRSKGDESIELTRAAGGGRLQFIARTLGSGRGLTGSTNVFDEAYALTVGQYAAQTPTLATIPNPRIVYTSTPPDEDTGPMPEDAMLPSVRARGHAGEDRVGCLEWSPAKGFDREDRAVWYDCNPALGIRISEWFLAKQLKAFVAAGRPEKFDTEHLGVWPEPEAEPWQVISEAEWRAAGDPESQMVGRPAFVIAMSMNRQWTVVAAAGARADGLRHVEVIKSFPTDPPGTVALVKELRRKWRPWAIGVRPTGPAASLLGDLEAARLEVTRINTPEGCQASGIFFDGVCGQVIEGKASPRNVRHRCQDLLTVAVARAARRKVNNVWTWDMQSPAVDCSPLEAVSDALYLFVNKGRRRPPPAERAAAPPVGDFFRPQGRLSL